MALLYPLFVIGGLALLTLLVGGSMSLEGSLTIGEFVAVHLYRGMLMWPMISLGWVISLWQRGRAAMDRLASLMLSTEAVVEQPLEHLFLPGIYVRKVFNPAGSLIVTRT